MELPRIIAIDGPAASGKSTVGFAVAQRINYLYFDTGAMYRAVTWAAMARGLDLADLDAIGTLAESLVIDISAPQPDTSDGRQTTVLVDGQDVTWAIRSPDVDRSVSVVAANPRVRVALTRHQRRISERFSAGISEAVGLVMVGRDIGTVVLPDAPIKIYLDASAEERARRRYEELRRRGKEVPYAAVLADMRRRDDIDTHRAVAPLRAAADAHILDTTGFTIEEIVEQILDLMRREEVKRD
ncbi:MAG: (d)CMP kinase [Caldilineaceae bacterium]|nr:(d)CMP kinase [Caldilineaceae bacterium]